MPAKPAALCQEGRDRSYEKASSLHISAATTDQRKLAKVYVDSLRIATAAQIVNSICVADERRIQHLVFLPHGESLPPI